MAKSKTRTTWLEKVFDYPIGACESVCIGRMYNEKGAFRARPWPDTDALVGDTHYSVSLFDQTVPYFRRRADRWTGTVMIGLDDVGEIKHGVRILEPREKPTFIMQTKPGSQQWIYCFDRIVRDASLIETMGESAAKGGISDAGAVRGIATRILRLPGSKPPKKEHRAKMVWSDWSRRFNPDDLIQHAWGVPTVEKRAGLFGGGRKGVPAVVKKGQDKLLDWLADQDQVIGSVDSAGWVKIVCPFWHEHTGGDQTGTAYHVPHTGDAMRSFKCWHTACDERSSGHFRDGFVELGAPWVPVIGDGKRPRAGLAGSLSERAVRRIFNAW